MFGLYFYDISAWDELQSFMSLWGLLFFMRPFDFITVVENVKVLLVSMLGVNHADG